MKSPEKYILSWLKYITEFLSFVIFCYIFFSHLFRLIKPVEFYIDQRAFDISYLRFLFFLGCILGVIGWIIALFEDRKRLKISTPFSHNIKENISYAFIALFLAVFYNGVFSFLGILQYPTFLFLLAFFYFLIPQLVNFYLSFNFSDFKKLLDETFAFRRELIKAGKEIGKKTLMVGEKMAETGEEINRKTSEVGELIVDTSGSVTRRTVETSKELTRRSFEIGQKIKRKTLTYLFMLVFILFSLFVTVFSFLLVSEIISEFIQGKTYKENLIRKQLYITKIAPTKAIHTQRVRLDGYNFGWKTGGDERYKVMTTDGPIRLLEEWTNERLEFTVSLDTPTGRKELWIERPTDNPRNKNVIKSNIVRLDVMSRFVLYPDPEDTRFERIIKRVKRILFFNFPLFNNFLFTSYE